MNFDPSLPPHLASLATQLAVQCGAFIPELTVYARHSPDCSNSSPDLISCDCKKYIYVGRTPQSKERRVATYSRSSEQAKIWLKQIRQLFDPEKRELYTLRQNAAVQTERKQVLIETALEDWIADKEQNKPDGRIDGVYYTLQNQLTAFAHETGLHYLHELNTAHLTRWRNSWDSKKKGGIKKKTSRLINFFAFSVRMGWLEKNPAGGRQNPDGGLSKVTGDDWEPMAPLSQTQFESVLDACWRYPVLVRKDSHDGPLKVWTFTLLLRWSGLSPIDALKLRRDQLDDNDVLTVARAKTGKALAVKLPDWVAEALRNVPPPRQPHPAYFFWNGFASDAGLRSMYFKWYRKLWPLVEPQLELYTLTGKRYRPHPYIFRGTFAVEYLSAPHSSVHDLAKLMGNTVAMIEKHYVPLVPRLREAVLERQAATFKAQGGLRPAQPGRVIAFKRLASAAKVGS